MTQLKIERGYLYLAALNPRFGSEPGKVRPVLVIQSNLLNSVGHPSTWIIPCTTKLSGESLLRVVLPTGIAGNQSDCELMIDQFRTIDNSHLKKQLGILPSVIMKEIRRKILLLGDF